MNNITKPAKTKKPQPKTASTPQLRDNFLTPKYAVNILLPFLSSFGTVWECANGSGNITRALKGKRVFTTDINGSCEQHNFILDGNPSFIEEVDVIVTNVPFSLKQEFIERALELDKPFAFLVPFDMSMFLWDCFKNRRMEALVPERRIDYLTPNIVSRINEGLGVIAVNKARKTKFKKFEQIYESDLEIYNKHKGSYSFIEEVPVKIVRKFSSSDFHSFWICHKLNLPQNFTFVELSNKQKDDIF